MSLDSVAACIVDFNSAECTERCVTSLFNAGLTKIVVLDNAGSKENRVALGRVGERHPISIVQSETNLGFGRGANAAAAHAIEKFSPNYLWIVNPDVVVDPESARTLLATAEGWATPALFSPLLLQDLPSAPSDSRCWFAGGHIDRKTLRVRHDAFGEDISHVTADQDCFETDFIPGTALFTSVPLWRNLNGFREDLFLYYEDVELALRCHARRTSLVVVPAARAWHSEGGTQTSNNARFSSLYYYYMARNRIVVARDEGLALVRPSQMMETLRSAVRPLAHNGFRQLQTLSSALRGTRDGLLHRPRSSGRTQRYADIASGLLERSANEPVSVTWLNHYSAQVADLDALDGCDMIGVDGTLLQGLLLLSGVSISRSSADLFMPHVLDATSADRHRIAFVGSAPGVAESAARNLGIAATCIDGFDGLASLLENIESFAANFDVVVLGLGAPLQERVANQLRALAQPILILTAGGWLDQMAVSPKYFAANVHKLRLGWLRRLIDEPARLWRRYTVFAVTSLWRTRPIVSILRNRATGATSQRLFFEARKFGQDA